MPLLTENDVVPDFSLSDQDGTIVRLDQFRGQALVMWWYPKADTPG